ncbi:MAG: GMC family oxidoreductase, partial [Cyclobacteriaceae bacterium]|nr:GMC family oxidoreductase [Cyclobacteriaceae bacterium]
MANLNLKAEGENTYDAIVVGTGISGGWAIKELTEKGLKVLALEKGRDVKHGDYPTAMLDPWQLPNGDRLPDDVLEKDYWVQNRTGYTIRESTKHWWIKDSDEPYAEDKRFDWIRGYHVGGRSLLWGRQSYRLSNLDFEANLKDGVAVDWPVRYEDLAPWYDYVETFAGISGQAEGLPHLPDGKFLPPMELNCVEKDFKSKIASKFNGRNLTIGRTAIVTKEHNGRGPCQYRNRCMRGCPFGAYFSSQSATLPAAYATGNLTMRPHSAVESVIYDDTTGKAKGVRVIDSQTGETIEFFAKIIFLNASTIASTHIMLNSKSDRFPNGLGNDSGELGHNLMDHHFRTGARASVEGFEDKYYFGRRANGIYIPRFRNLNGNDMPYIRGFGYQGGASRSGWNRNSENEFGSDMIQEVSKPGPWSIGINGFGECLPYHENHMRLDENKKD